MVGVILVHLLLGFLSLLIFVGIIGSLMISEKAPSLKEPTVLHLTFDAPVPDRTSENPLENFDLFSMTMQKSTGLNEVLRGIEQASADQRIAGIYLDLSDISSNFGALASVEEIRNALIAFKESGKFIYSYSSSGYSQKSYYLATVADSLFVHPQAPLLLYGMSSGVAFYKETLKKLGIQPEVIRVGKFKAAVEPFLDTRMSDDNRLQLETYLNSMWGTLVEGISTARNIPVERIHELADNFRFYAPTEFVEAGLFDGTLYEDQMLDKLKALTGDYQPADKLRTVSLSEYGKATPSLRMPSPDQIAVIYAQGEIVGSGSASAITPALVEVIREARLDESVKAIVLRVNSPGGSAHVSDLIWREVQLATESKPVVASMGNVAASGGYYISCAANAIVASPTTLTGSIGIFGLLFSAEELIVNKLGLRTETVKTNKYSDFGGNHPLPVPLADRPLTPYERGVMQQYINEGYDTFLDRVAQGRNITKEEVDRVAQGRVWTGTDALRIGLVDRLGGLNEAIELASELAGLPTYQITELPTSKNFWEEILSNTSANIRQAVLKAELGEQYMLYRSLKNSLDQQGVVARIPYDISIR